jgi:hypothetical protein
MRNQKLRSDTVHAGNEHGGSHPGKAGIEESAESAQSTEDPGLICGTGSPGDPLYKSLSLINADACLLVGQGHGSPLEGIQRQMDGIENHQETQAECEASHFFLDPCKISC